MVVNQISKNIPLYTEGLPLGKGYVTIDKKEEYSHGLRWKLGINTNPCVQLRRGRRCIYCGFLNYHNPVSPFEVGRVFGEILKNNDLNNIQRLELYVSGSFFDSEEVSFDSRSEIIRTINESGIKEVVVESRPEFITPRNLKALTDIIDPTRITIAIGVETMDDKLRNKLSKGFSTKDLTGSLSTIARAGINFQAYLLLNPPVINNDRNAIIDIIDSAKKIISLANKMNCSLTLAIQPFFFAQNSAVAGNPSQRDSIRPPWLYTIALTLKLLNTLRIKQRLDLPIVLGNENDNVDTISIPANYASNGTICPCTETIRKHLREINISQQKFEENIDRILESTCACKGIWENEIGKLIVN